MCLGVFHLGFILFGTLWISWTWVDMSFPILGMFSTIISSIIFSWPFFLSSSSGTPIGVQNWSPELESNTGIRVLGHLTLSQRSLRLSSFLLIIFFPFSSLLHLFLPFYLPPHLSSALVILRRGWLRDQHSVGSLQSVFYLNCCIIHY